MDYSRQSIETLMALAITGDQRAYCLALTQIKRLIYPFLLKHLSGSAEIEDVLQDVLLSVHKALKTYDGSRPFKPWIFAITRYRLNDFLRKSYKDTLRDAEDLTQVDAMPQAHSAETSISYETIHKEISKLPTKQSQILQMIHSDGYTSREVAANLNMREIAVRVAAHRAYKILRKKLEM